MTQPDFRARCAELVNELHGYKALHPEHGTDLIDRACRELATPPPEENTKPGFINVCVEGPPPAPYEYWEDWLVDTFKNRTIKGVCIRALISGDFSFDKKEAATPPPEPPMDGEVAELVAWLRLESEDWRQANPGGHQGARLARAAELLERTATELEGTDG